MRGFHVARGEPFEEFLGIRTGNLEDGFVREMRKARPSGGGGRGGGIIATARGGGNEAAGTHD